MVKLHAEFLSQQDLSSNKGLSSNEVQNKFKKGSDDEVWRSKNDVDKLLYFWEMHEQLIIKMPLFSLF